MLCYKILSAMYKNKVRVLGYQQVCSVVHDSLVLIFLLIFWRYFNISFKYNFTEILCLMFEYQCVKTIILFQFNRRFVRQNSRTANGQLVRNICAGKSRSDCLVMDWPRGHGPDWSCFFFRRSFKTHNVFDCYHGKNKVFFYRCFQE